MSRDAEGPVGPAGPVLVGLHGTAPAEEALRYAFDEAERRGVELRVVLTGELPQADSDLQADVVRRWAEKYPEVTVRSTVRRRIDPAVVLAAASHGCGLLIVQQPSTPGSVAWVDALSRRAWCPVDVVRAARVAISPPG